MRAHPGPESPRSMAAISLMLLTGGAGGLKGERPIAAYHREAPGILADPAAELRDPVVLRGAALGELGCST